jgi:calcium binding protein 39
MLDILKLGKSEKPKHTPTEVIEKCVTALDTLHENPLDKGADKAKAVVSKCLKDLKYWLFHAPTDEDGYEPTKEHVVDLAHKVLRTNMLHYIVLVLDQLEFEVRKDAAQVFGAIVRIKEGPDELCPGAAYVAAREAILEKLIDGCVPPAGRLEEWG